MTQEIQTSKKPRPFEALLPVWWKFWETIPMAWRYMRNDNIPTNAKIAYGLACAGLGMYVLFPIDAVPEIIFPVIGYIDDLGTIPAFFAFTNMFNKWCQDKLHIV